MRPSLRSLMLALIAASLTVGCVGRPTYPKARVAESLHALLQDDHIDAAVRFLDHTLAVQFDYPGALAQSGGQIGIGPAFDEASRKVLTALHRVLLSTDADVRFYVLLMSDALVPGAYLTMVRYMDDIRKANAQMLDTQEIFARTIFELNVVGPNALTLDQYLPRDIQMEEFLSWQLSRRIQSALADELEAGGVANVGRCTGRFEDGEFAFTLNVAPPAETLLDEATMQKVFQVSMNVVAKVLASYRFDAFNSVRLIHPFSGRMLLLPKTRLEPFK